MEKLRQSARTTFSNLPPEKQEKIVAAAVREFARHGYRKASSNTIVREAGIAKGSLYQYFRNKEVLFVFIFERFTLLVKKAVAEQGGSSVARAREGGSATAEQGGSSVARAREGGSMGGQSGPEPDFFSQVGRVLLAGMAFIDQYPEYFQIYLRVLFEEDIPMREKLLAQVRLFSREYFGPLCEAGQKSGAIRRDIPLAVVIFVLDAALDRFLQGYAQGTLGRELALGQGNREELLARVEMILQVLREGLAEAGTRHKA
ncbi:MAG: TetR/AcrR family transcriptional regulator [Desulfurivibrio sp.]|nr:MAG: TetR/AcrR family transcriptional regulator [Desulfurivibrio sp.]